MKPDSIYELSRKASCIGESLDLRFSHLARHSSEQSEVINLFQAKLYQKRDYMLSRFKGASIMQLFKNDDHMIIELT